MPFTPTQSGQLTAIVLAHTLVGQRHTEMQRLIDKLLSAEGDPDETRSDAQLTTLLGKYTNRRQALRQAVNDMPVLA